MASCGETSGSLAAEADTSEAKADAGRGRAKADAVRTQEMKASVQRAMERVYVGEAREDEGQREGAKVPRTSRRSRAEGPKSGRGRTEAGQDLSRRSWSRAESPEPRGPKHVRGRAGHREEERVEQSSKDAEPEAGGACFLVTECRDGVGHRDGSVPGERKKEREREREGKRGTACHHHDRSLPLLLVTHELANMAAVKGSGEEREKVMGKWEAQPRKCFFCAQDLPSREQEAKAEAGGRGRRGGPMPMPEEVRSVGGLVLRYLAAVIKSKSPSLDTFTKSRAPRQLDWGAS